MCRELELGDRWHTGQMDSSASPSTFGFQGLEYWTVPIWIEFASRAPTPSPTYSLRFPKKSDLSGVGDSVWTFRVWRPRARWRCLVVCTRSRRSGVRVRCGCRLWADCPGSSEPVQDQGGRERQPPTGPTARDQRGSRGTTGAAPVGREWEQRSSPGTRFLQRPG
jgi:hypothetical protein